MTACPLLFKALEKRIGEKDEQGNHKYNLDSLGQELCPKVKDPKGKIIRLIKIQYGEEFLTKNASWLGYDTKKVHPPKNNGVRKNVKEDAGATLLTSESERAQVEFNSIIREFEGTAGLTKTLRSFVIKPELFEVLVLYKNTYPDDCNTIIRRYLNDDEKQ